MVACWMTLIKSGAWETHKSRVRYCPSNTLLPVTGKSCILVPVGQANHDWQGATENRSSRRLPHEGQAGMERRLAQVWRPWALHHV